MITKIKTNELTAGKWFRNLRKEEGYTLENLSTMSGISISSIHKIEKEKHFPNPSTVISLLRLMYGDDIARYEKELAIYQTLRKRNILKQKQKNRERLGVK